MPKSRLRLALSLAAVLLACATNACDAVAHTSATPVPDPASHSSTDIAVSNPVNAASSSPSPTSSATGAPCVTSGLSGVCGPYSTTDITGSNGYNTYVGNNMWGAKGTSTTQTLTAYRPDNWMVVASAPTGNTGVLTYPNVEQLFNDWCGSGWRGCPNATDTPVSKVASLTSSFTESMPRSSGTDAEAGYDIWLTHVGSGAASEIMVWVDNANRGTGGADKIGTAAIDGQNFTVLQYGGSTGEIIFSLNNNEETGSVDILGAMKWLISHGHEPAGVTISQVDFGWEICSTGSASETFRVSRYSISACAAGQACAS